MSGLKTVRREASAAAPTRILISATLAQLWGALTLEAFGFTLRFVERQEL
jgi:hypothetical protein